MKDYKGLFIAIVFYAFFVFNDFNIPKFYKDILSYILGGMIIIRVIYLIVKRKNSIEKKDE